MLVTVITSGGFETLVIGITNSEIARGKDEFMAIDAEQAPEYFSKGKRIVIFTGESNDDLSLKLMGQGFLPAEIINRSSDE